jgi:Vitamin K-dependent gamma-carboxylase
MKRVVRALGALRIAVGTIFLIRTTALLYLVPGLVEHHGGPLTGWPSPGWRIAWGGLVLADPIVKALCVVRTIAGVLFTLGMRARAAGVVAVGAAYLVYAQEPFAFIFTLHALFLSVLILSATDAVAGRALVSSLARSPSSSVWLVRAFVLSIYGFSALAKLRAPWLSGATLDALYRAGYLTGHVADALLGAPARAAASAVLTAALEAGLVPLLFFRRSRAVGVALACMMHATFELTAHPDVFGFLMVALLSAFWPARYLPTTTRQPPPSIPGSHPPAHWNTDDGNLQEPATQTPSPKMASDLGPAHTGGGAAQATFASPASASPASASLAPSTSPASLPQETIGAAASSAPVSKCAPASASSSAAASATASARLPVSRSASAAIPTASSEPQPGDAATPADATNTASPRMARARPVTGST